MGFYVSIKFIGKIKILMVIFFWVFEFFFFYVGVYGVLVVFGDKKICRIYYILVFEFFVFLLYVVLCVYDRILFFCIFFYKYRNFFSLILSELVGDV